MTCWPKAFSWFLGSLTPCGVSTGILSFGDGIVVGALGGGSGIWGKFKFITYYSFLFHVLVFVFSLSLFFSLFFCLSVGGGLMAASYFNSHITWPMFQVQT